MLVKRNITVAGHRTSIRLEPEFWSALASIAERERVTIDELCTEVDRGSGDLSRTAAIRVFITSYMVRLVQRHAGQLATPGTTVGSDYSDSRDSDGRPKTERGFRAVS